MLIGRRTTSSCWHMVRRPASNESTKAKRADKHWLMSLCSLVWKVQELKMGKPTCLTCLARWKSGRGRLVKLVELDRRR
jgi:hypothetical protein